MLWCGVCLRDMDEFKNVFNDSKRNVNVQTSKQLTKMTATNF